MRTENVTLTFSGCKVVIATKKPGHILDAIDKGSGPTIWQAGAFRDKPPANSIEVDEIVLHAEDDDEETAVA